MLYPQNSMWGLQGTTGQGQDGERQRPLQEAQSPRKWRYFVLDTSDSTNEKSIYG